MSPYKVLPMSDYTVKPPYRETPTSVQGRKPTAAGEKSHPGRRRHLNVRDMGTRTQDVSLHGPKVRLPTGKRSRYLSLEGHATFPQKVTLPFPKRSCYLSPEGHATFPYGRSWSAFSISYPTHQGTPTQTSTPRMGGLPSYWSFKDDDRTRIKPRHRKHLLRQRKLMDVP